MYKNYIGFVCMTFCVFFIGGCQDIASVDGVEIDDQSVIFTPGETWAGPSQFSNDENHRSGVSYAMATANITTGTGLCSAFLIGPSKLVTADHCLPKNAPLDYEVKLGFGRVRNEGYLHLLTTLNLFYDLGYRGNAQVSLAVDFARNGVEEHWYCNLVDRDGNRDIAYFECPPKLVMGPSGSGYAVLYPGDLFGHLDPVATNPGNDVPVYYLTVNRRLSDSNPRRILLSPNGRVQNRGATPCASGYSSHCTGTQGADLLPGSSGGAVLLRSSNKVFGVSSLHRWTGGGNSYSRTPRCHTGFLCWPNKNMFARFTAKVYEEQFLASISSLTTHTSYTTTPMLGVGGSSYHELSCAANEAVVGLIGSTYTDSSTNEARLANLGVICGPVTGSPDTLAIWQSTNFFVQTGGSLDTKYYATPNATSNDRARWNRYRRTIFSNQGSGSSYVKEQETLLCPPSMALTEIEVSVQSSRILAVSGIVCNSLQGDSTTKVTMNPRSRSFGRASGEASMISCSTGRVSSGMNVWTHPYTSRMQLRCRQP